MEIYCIRKAKLNDIESIAIIKVMGWQIAYRGIVDDEYLNSMSISEQIEILKKHILWKIYLLRKKIMKYWGFADFVFLIILLIVVLTVKYARFMLCQIGKELE